MTSGDTGAWAAAAAGGRRPRMSLDQVERAVLDTARRLLIEQHGMTVSLDHINLEIIIAAAGVPRSSAFRRWPTKEDFVIDFLCDIAGPSWAGTAAFDIETLRTAITALQENIDLLTESVDDRRRLIDEVVRRAAKQNYDAVITSPEWRTYVALTATVASISDLGGRARIREALNRAETYFVDRMATFYEALGGFLGFRMKDPYTYWHLAATGAAVVEGLALRHTVGISMVDQPLQITENGETKQWVLAAAGFKAIVDSMIEIDPDYERPSEEIRAILIAGSADDLIALIGIDAT